MKATISLRERLGLSQQEIADYLQVTRRQLSMYETGRRELPTLATIALGELEMLLLAPLVAGKDARSHVKVQQAKTKKLLAKHAELQKHKQFAAQRQLDVMRESYSQKMLLLDLIDRMREKMKDGDKRQTLALDIMELQALIVIGKNGLDKQALLELRISGLQQQYDQALQLQQEIAASL